MNVIFQIQMFFFSKMCYNKKCSDPSRDGLSATGPAPPRPLRTPRPARRAAAPLGAGVGPARRGALAAVAALPGVLGGPAGQADQQAEGQLEGRQGRGSHERERQVPAQQAAPGAVQEGPLFFLSRPSAEI